MTVNKYVVAETIEAVFQKKIRVPTTVMWNRLEGRPRRPDFTRALKAEVRDPLWMITRQWQMGEFIGEDAGSPVNAKVAWETDQVTELKLPNGTRQPYDSRQPLEALIEARKVPLQRNNRLHNAELRLALGRRWKKLLVNSGHHGRVVDYLTAYAFDRPDPDVEADNAITAHAANWQTLAAIATRAIDGGALFLQLSQSGALASDGMGMVDPEKSEIDDLGTEFLNWATALYFQQGEGVETWNAKQLEYGVGLSAPNGSAPAALHAPEYHGGRLDWFNFDAVAPDNNDVGGVANTPEVTSFIPATIQFDGMPNTRHWTFEEGVINFGDINPDTTDIAKLLLIEFGLVFANDWFLLPVDLPVGSLTEIKGLALTNVFGERLWVEPAVSSVGPTDGWQMFRLTNKGAVENRLFLPATTPTGLESEPVETVCMIRDEVSNMVWGIETMVQLPDGTSRRGREVALELHAKFQNAVAAPPVPVPALENNAKIQYSLMTSVAEHWIPFIPVHIENDNQEIQLQRAAMPRLLEGQDGVLPKKIAPRSGLLREGLEVAPRESYFLVESEVARSGMVVDTKWQRCRWQDGQVVTWLGHHRKTGRGESSSGLAFDTIKPKIMD